MAERRSDGAVDTAIAVVATLAALVAAIERARSDSVGGTLYVLPGMAPRVVLGTGPLGPTPFFVVLGIALTTAPLALRRRYPATSFGIIMAAVIATHHYTTTVSFAAAIFAAYSAVVYSKYRRMALLSVATAAIIVTAAFPNTTPPVPARFTAFLILLPTVAVALAMRTWRQRAGDSAARLLRGRGRTRGGDPPRGGGGAGPDRERAARRGDAQRERDGGAGGRRAPGARQLAPRPRGPDAIEALLAVEASGRTAMGELRHLLGLLAPSGEAPGGDDVALVPQPDVGQVRSLVERVRAAGLPVELTITGARALPPGVDLAAYRVVQEALTNVIKHANQARTVVRIEYRPGELLIDVADDGAAGVPRAGRPQPGGGRGLIGLRERLALYGGDLDAGPRPGGGWRVRARIPLEPAAARVAGIAGQRGHADVSAALDAGAPRGHRRRPDAGARRLPADPELRGHPGGGRGRGRPGRPSRPRSSTGRTWC